jgi:hypothetical protein
LTEKFFVRRLSANLTTLIRSGLAPGTTAAVARTSSMFALQGSSAFCAPGDAPSASAMASARNRDMRIRG